MMNSSGSPISQSSLCLDVARFCCASRVLLRFFIMGARYSGESRTGCPSGIEQSTAPLIEFYQNLGLLLPIAARGTPEEICQRTLATLDSWRVLRRVRAVALR